MLEEGGARARARGVGVGWPAGVEASAGVGMAFVGGFFPVSSMVKCKSIFTSKFWIAAMIAARGSKGTGGIAIGSAAASMKEGASPQACLALSSFPGAWLEA